MTGAWRERLWAVIGGVGVQTKILGIVLILVLTLGLGVTIQVRATLTQTMENQLEEQSVSVGRDLAARATDLLLINDLYALQQLLRETQANNANVRYAFVVDPQGRIVAHTFGSGFPAGLHEQNTVDGSDHHATTLLRTDEGPIWDTAVPIFEGRAGVARVGLDETRVRQAVDAVTSQLLLTTMLVSVVGITAAAALTFVLTRPLRRLAQAARAVGQGDLSQRVPRWANDEIGDLADSFNSMTHGLAQAAEEHAEREQLRLRFVSAVITAQEEERKRIARELHDGTSQSLTSLVVGMRTLGALAPGARERAEELRQVAVHTLDEVHALALQLRPSVLDDLGLAAAIERTVQDCRRRHGLDVDLVIQGLDGERLPTEIETALYRIVQEGLTNVARHAQANTAAVVVERRLDALHVIVEDDGCGFDPEVAARADQRLGLYGIRERAELLGGTFTVESAPGRGTSLFISVPTGLTGEHHA
jgi:signal transduction histidine kinase